MVGVERVWVLSAVRTRIPREFRSSWYWTFFIRYSHALHSLFQSITLIQNNRMTIAVERENPFTRSSMGVSRRLIFLAFVGLLAPTNSRFYSSNSLTIFGEDRLDTFSMASNETVLGENTHSRMCWFLKLSIASSTVLKQHFQLIQLHSKPSF